MVAVNSALTLLPPGSSLPLPMNKSPGKPCSINGFVVHGSDEHRRMGSHFSSPPLFVRIYTPKILTVRPWKMGAWKTTSFPIGFLCNFSGANSLLNFRGVLSVLLRCPDRNSGKSSVPRLPIFLTGFYIGYPSIVPKKNLHPFRKAN